MPPTSAARRLLLSELDKWTGACSDSASFLAMLGAVWLEEGHPAQALVWLERAMLLDPQSLGTRADHALALAALGENTARDELLQALIGRKDVPPALLARLRAATESAGRAVAPPPMSGNGGRWIQRGEASLRAGHDTNLDRAPVLDGITLTSPDGPSELPLAVPLRPRPGDALAAEIAWRLAYDTGQGSMWLVGAGVTARHAPNASSTDWHFGQVRAEYWRAAADWRVQWHGSLAQSGGALGEPYGFGRLGTAVERDRGACTMRASLEAEARRQRESAYLDGNLVGVLVSQACTLGDRRKWRVGVELRASRDRPRTANRPGGTQRQQGAAFRLAGETGRWTIDASYALAIARDDEGFSALLENDARRYLRQTQAQVEFGHPIAWPADRRGEVFLLWSSVDQTSNIPLFSNRGQGLFAGLRWRW